MKNEFDEAVDLYLKVIKNIDNDTQISGDINVKTSSIMQGQGKLEEALVFLIKARDIYSKCMQQAGDTVDQALGIKLIETITGTANIYVDQGEIKKASDTYQVSEFWVIGKTICQPLDIVLIFFHRMQ